MLWFGRSDQLPGGGFESNVAASLERPRPIDSLAALQAFLAFVMIVA